MKDDYRNTVTSYTGTVQIASNGVLSGAPVTSGSFVGGVLTSQSVTITSAQTGTTLSATEAVSGANGSSNSFTVNPAGINFLIEASSGGDIAPQTVGANFGVRITARNADNSTATGFTGTVTLSSTAGTIGPGSVVFGSGDHGVVTISNATLTQAGTNRTITATSGSDTGTSNDFT
ncbi:MAG: hypothetical protein Q8K86_11410, partial [Candidatus Nanopelagicaceae bacterium]|nr:hypothetical protein [Candidatus Nanopelagicaceae bacterium]